MYKIRNILGCFIIIVLVLNINAMSNRPPIVIVKIEGNIIFYLDGGRYEGDKLNKKREGKGIMYYANGDKYIGEWKNDMREGRGTTYYANGKIYTAIWKNDSIWEGKGIENNLKESFIDLYAEGFFHNGYLYGWSYIYGFSDNNKVIMKIYFNEKNEIHYGYYFTNNNHNKYKKEYFNGNGLIIYSNINKIQTNKGYIIVKTNTNPFYLNNEYYYLTNDIYYRLRMETNTFRLKERIKLTNIDFLSK